MSALVTPAPTTTGAPVGALDPRGARVAAAITATVLAVTLLSAPSPVATLLLLAQTAVFAIGASRGVAATPYALFFRQAIRPRLAPPTEWEDPAPPRFAQGVGLLFGLVGLAGLLTGATTVGLIAVGLALAAALLNAVFGFCLGCEIYLRVARLRAA
ncbi:MAG: DUF4395 domain-containing protein [Nocardioides sp.]